MKICPHCKKRFEDDEANHCPRDGTRLEIFDPLTGKVLVDTYRLTRVLGEGGMGRVFEAEHVRLKKRYAVKVLKPELATDKELLKRFEREAQSAGGLGHAGILDVVDFNCTFDGVYFIVTEFLQGRSLGEILEEDGPMDVLRVVPIFHQMCRALSVAHKNGIVHRDLKPENVFLVEAFDTQDFAKILDFGISKVLWADGALTASGQIIGTPHYMAPEQAEGKLDLDHRADIYSLGAMMYEMITGEPPFDADTAQGVLLKAVTEKPKPPRLLRPDLPAEMEELILRCMARDPADRFQTMDEVGVALGFIWERYAPPHARWPSSSHSMPAAAVGPDFGRGGSGPHPLIATPGEGSGPHPLVAPPGQGSGAHPVYVGGPESGPHPAVYGGGPESGPHPAVYGGGPESGPQPTVDPIGPTQSPVFGTGPHAATHAAPTAPPEGGARWGLIIAILALAVVAGVGTVGALMYLGYIGGGKKGSGSAATAESRSGNKNASATNGNGSGATSAGDSGTSKAPVDGGKAPVRTRPGPRIKSPKGMVYVKGGTFWMGRKSGGRKYERPAHQVFVADFHLDKTEVSNKAYARYLTRKGKGRRSPWTQGRVPRGKARFPVTNVTWKDADAYCRSVPGRRLPTEPEWEYAARGGPKHEHLYPWGPDFDASRVVCSVGRKNSIQPVESGQAAGGLRHMIGNVWEWTGTRYEPYPGSLAPKSAYPLYLLRGGGAESTDAQELTATYRGFHHPERTPDGKLAASPNLGFRCAMDVIKPGVEPSARPTRPAR